jgi:branched-chain amino acid transport system permease protein
LIVGILDIIDFGQGTYAMLGMFICYWLLKKYDTPLFASFPIAFVTLFVVGTIVGKFIFLRALDIPRQYTLVITYGIMMFVTNAAQLVWTGNYRSLGISYGSIKCGNISISLDYLLAFIVSGIIAWIMFIFLSKSKVGKAIRAISQDAEAAASLGIDVGKLRVMSVGMATGLSGLAGAIFALVYYIYPYLGGLLGFHAILICILGGLGDYRGAFFGGLILGLAHSLSTLFIPYGLKDAVGFMLFIIVLLFKPKGLFGKGR